MPDFYTQPHNESIDPVQRLMYDRLNNLKMSDEDFVRIHYRFMTKHNPSITHQHLATHRKNIRRVMMDAPVSRLNFVRIMRIFNVAIDVEELDRAITDQAAVPELAKALEQRKALVNQLQAQTNSN